MSGEKTRIKNLRQYKDLPEKEYDNVYEEIIKSRLSDNDFEERIKEKMDEFEEDYDIADLKFNDRATLRGLIQALITLEDLEQVSYRLRMQAVDDELTLGKIDRITRTMSTTRSDIASLQEVLNITRKIRKGEREESVMAYIQSLHKKANEFINAKFGRIYCPQCKMLIGSVWSLYPEGTKFTFTCGRTLEDGSKCGTKVNISYKELLENDMRNIEDAPAF